MRIIWTRTVNELDRLHGPLHALWVDGRDNAEARRKLKRLMSLCAEVAGKGWAEPRDDEEEREACPTAAPAAAAWCMDAIERFKDAVWRAERVQKLRDSERTNASDYRRLSEFPKNYRDAIRKAAQRGKSVNTRRAPKQRFWLYSVADVVEKYGDGARPKASRSGTSNGHDGTRRDK